MKLKEIREEVGLSQKALAEKLGVSHTNIYNYEVGRTEPSVEMLIKLAAALDVSVGYLVGAEGDDGQVVPKDLTEDEKKLLSDYRKLNVYQKETVLTQISAIVKR